MTRLQWLACAPPRPPPRRRTGHQAVAPNFSSIGGSTEHNSHRNKWCSTAHPPPGFFFKNLLLYTLEGKWCFLLFRYFLYSHRALFFGGKFICPQFSFLTDDHAPVLLFHRWQRLIPPSDPLFPSHLKLKNLSIVSIILHLSSFSSAST